MHVQLHHPLHVVEVKAPQIVCASCCSQASLFSEATCGMWQCGNIPVGNLETPQQTTVTSDLKFYLSALFLGCEPLVPGQGCASGVQHPELAPSLLHLVSAVWAQVSWQCSRCVLEQLQYRKHKSLAMQAVRLEPDSCLANTKTCPGCQSSCLHRCIACVSQGGM